MSVPIGDLGVGDADYSALSFDWSGTSPQASSSINYYLSEVSICERSIDEEVNGRILIDTF